MSAQHINRKRSQWVFTFISLLTTTTAFANTITVTNNSASGSGSLSNAVATANADTNADTIVFNAGVNSIALPGTLVITHPVTIDGTSTTAPGGKVSITGFGFDVKPTANGTTLTNLSISTNYTNGVGVLVEGSSDFITNDVISGSLKGVDETGGSNTYTGDYIGTDVTGTTAVSNGYGLYLEGSGHDKITGNVISGNHTDYNAAPILHDPNDNGFQIWGAGIWINSSTAGYNTISNNKFGTDVSGTSIIENGSGVLSFAGNNQLTQNQLTGYHVTLDDPNNPIFGRGFIMMPGADSNMISNNLIGAYKKATGQYVQIASRADDIDLKSNSNTVQKNIFLGTRAGVAIAGYAGSTANNNNIIQYNLMGIDPNGVTYGAAYGALVNGGTGNKILYNNIFTNNATIFGGSIVVFANNSVVQGNVTAGGEKGIGILFGNNNVITGNIIYNTVGADTADNGDVWTYNIFSGNALAINDHGANATYSYNVFINPVYVPYEQPFFTHLPQADVFTVHSSSTVISNNVFTGAGASPNMGPAILATSLNGDKATGLSINNNLFTNYPVSVSFDSGHSASLNNNAIVGLGKNSSNISYGVQTTGTGNTVTLNNSSISNETYGFYGDSSNNTFSLSNDAFQNNFYGIFDTSSAHNFNLKNDSFKGNTYNTN